MGGTFVIFIFPFYQLYRKIISMEKVLNIYDKPVGLVKVYTPVGCSPLRKKELTHK